jgi:tetratricopeptide (TPR) repeat protein
LETQPIIRPIVTGASGGAGVPPALSFCFAASLLLATYATPAFARGETVGIGAQFGSVDHRFEQSPSNNRLWLVADSNTAEADRLYQHAEQSYGDRNYGDAASYLQTILSSNPNYARAHNLLGRIYHRSQKMDLAESEYHKAINSDPKLTEARFNLGVALFDQGNYKDAEHYFEEAAAKGHDTEYEYNLALTYQKLGKKDKAIEAYQRSIKSDWKNAVAHYSFGRLLQENGELEHAIQEYKTALQINPNFADAHNNLGVAYGAQGKYQDSIAEFQQALKVDPELPQAQQNLGFAQAHTSLGITYFKQGDLDKAFAEYKKALKIDPSFADAHYNLGLMYQQQGQLETAVGHYQAAIKFDHKNAKAHNNLGAAYSQLGKVDLAEAEYREALKLNPQYNEARQNLATLLQSQGKH